MHTRSRGFTLIELLVALAILALMALVSWRGLDAMTRAHSHIQERGDALLTLQAGLAQWAADLDAQVSLAPSPALDWDGRTLRITRYSTQTPGEGLPHAPPCKRPAPRPPSGRKTPAMCSANLRSPLPPWNNGAC